MLLFDQRKHVQWALVGELFSGTVYQAQQGNGAFRNGRRCKVSETAHLNECVLGMMLSPAGLARLAAAGATDARWLTQLIRSRRIDLVHSNTSVVLGGAVGARRVGCTPHLARARDLQPVRAGVAGLPPAAAERRRAAVRLAGDRRAVRRRRASAVVLHDGLPTEAARAPRADARAALGLPEPTRRWSRCSAGSPTGRDRTCSSARSRSRRWPAAARSACWPGDPWPGAEHRLESVRALAASLGVTGRLKVLGFRADVENVLGAADVVAVPSTAPDPLPNSALEAAAAGLRGGRRRPRRPSRDHPRRHLGTARVARGRRRARAGRSRTLIDDPALAARLGAAAAADVRARFAPERLLDELQSLYDDELSR